jgi:hypothetical protein
MCRVLSIRSAPNWYMNYYPVASKKFDPFKHPGHEEGNSCLSRDVE